MDTVISGAQIWAGDDAAAWIGDVRVSGQKIVEVSRQVGALTGGDPLVIDGSGHTLIPGLIEGHAHVTFNNFSSYWEMLAMPPEENLLVALENMKTYLDAGFTSLYSAGTVKLRLEAVVRDAINAGRWPGPRLRACCPTITTTGGLNDERRLHETRMVTSMIADGPDEMRKVVRLAAREGNDNIKFNISGDDDGIPPIASNITPMLESEVQAAMEIARLLGKSICAHTRTSEAVQMALRHGCDVLYHVDLIDEKTLDLMEAAKDRIFVGPGFGFFHEALKLDPSSGFDLDRARTSINNSERITKELRRRGIRAVIGGDYGTFLTPHGTNARDIAHLVRYGGYTPAEALRCATAIGGEMMMPQGGLGMLKPGYCADMLLVKGDPLADLSLLEDKDNFSLIMKDGLVHKAPASARVLLRTAA